MLHHRANMKLYHILGHIIQDGKVDKMPVDYNQQTRTNDTIVQSSSNHQAIFVPTPFINC